MSEKEYRDYLILEALSAQNDGYTIKWAKDLLIELYGIDLELYGIDLGSETKLGKISDKVPVSKV